MTITTKIVYEDFQTVEFSLTSTESIQYNKYDIRVRHADTVLDGSGGSVRIAIATVTKSKSFTLSSIPTLFPIPTTSTMTSGELYTATIRVHDDSGVWVSLPTCEFYYDTRTFTVDPVDVSSLVVDSSHNFVTTAPVVRVDDGVAVTLLASDDAFFSYFRYNTVIMSCADVSTEQDHVSTHYDLHVISYNQPYVWNVDGLPDQTAYELWGAINHALTNPSGNGWTFDASTEDYKYIVPEILPSFDITTSDSYGYYLENPIASVTLGDVSGTISTNAITFSIDNISSYEIYPFQSITFELKNVSGSTLFSKTFTSPSNDDDEYIVYAAGSNADAAFITAVTNGLVNGETYNCNITLNFTDTGIYSPLQYRTTVVPDEFNDELEPIVVASVVNSWQADPTEGNGLVVSFMKTDQFLGIDSALGANQFPANLDAYGDTYVFAEYSVTVDASNWSSWHTLDGGSIYQGGVSYTTDANLNDGRYLIPKHTSSSTVGSDQTPVYIYAEIPDQDQYQLVKVRLTLQTDNTSFVEDKRVSTIMYVDPVNTATYPVADASFRYFPKPVAHNFSNDKPIIDSIDSNNVLFLVPVSVPPFFMSNVTTSGGTSGTASVVTNYTPNASYNDVQDDVSGLSYLPALSSFQLTVSYVCDENPAIYTVDVNMTVQQQGFPSSSFNISACTWSNANQEIDYTLIINATTTSVDRMDGWNLYTKLSSEADSAFVSYGNLLRGNPYGLVQNVDLFDEYPDYSVIDVKFVATRSLYLASDNYENQVETVDGLLDVVDSESTQIINLPDTPLPPPVADDITLSNTIYDVYGSRSATLSVTLPENAIGVRIVNGLNTYETTSVDIALPPTPTLFPYTIEYEYNSMVDGDIVSVYSAATTVSFTSGVSNRGVPVIVSKELVSGVVFNVAYTSSNTGSYSNSVLTSDVYLDLTPDVNVGSDVGSVNLAAYQGSEVSMYVKDTFVSTYTVGGVDTTSTQVIDSDPVAVNLASNPKIVESSIAITSSRSSLQFSVNNYGTPFLDRILVVVAQDATDNEGDVGTYALAMFENTAGFTVAGSPYTNTIGATGTLSVIEISGTGMEMTTSFQFTPASDFSSAPANVVIHVSNSDEGSDSCAIANWEPL